MYHLFQLGDGGTSVHQGRYLLHQVGGMSSEDMPAYDSSVLVGNEFAQAVGLAHAHCLAVGPKERFFGCEGDASLLALLLGESHHTGFGTCKYG